MKTLQRLVAFILTLAMISGFPGAAMVASAAEESYVVPQFIMEATASSYEMNSDTCPPSNAIDGSGSSMWHTIWSSTPPSPHYLEVDLGRVMTVAGLTYLPRQNGGNNGTLGQYQVLYSVDGQQYQEAASGSWTVDPTEKEASFTPVSARYVRLQAVNATMMSCAELNILVTDSKYAALWAAWENAVTTLEGVDIGDAPGMYPQSDADMLQAAIDAAELVIADPTAEEDAIADQASTLNAALEAFLASMNHYSKEQLNALISEAEGLIENTPTGTENGQVPESAKTALSKAVAEAKDCLTGTSEEVHTAYLALEAAIERFEGQIAAQLISLAGTWQLKLGAYADGDAENTLEDTCVLPGTLDENEKGMPNNSVNLNKLNRKYTYTGKAVYQKEIYIPENWEGKSVTFLMERTKLTRVWVNGVEQTDCTSRNSLGTPQVYTLRNWTPGEYNTLTVEVENNNYPVGTGCHMLTDETVTNWNGIIGRMELEAKDAVHMDSIRIYPDITEKTATVKLAIIAEDTNGHSGTVTLGAESYNHDGAPQTVAEQTFEFSIPNGECTAEVELTYHMGENPVLWSEFDPALYHMTVTLISDGSSETSVESFGMREFKADGRKFSINGTTTFMRGEGNSAVFPLTGYPYMTKEEWLDFFKTAQELGINFFRFHSWTPPEAAFEAADELGIYMQPELYAFGGTPFMPNGDDTATSDYFFAEAERILEHLASHPSFVMMAWGNELDTTSTEKRAWASKLREACQDYDSTRLYAEGTNNNYWNPSFNTGDDYWTTCKTKANSDAHHIRISFSWVDAASGGHLESAQPSTDFTYENAIAGYTKPIMNHEAGQYQVLPNFDQEIPKYESGIFEARNLQSYRDLMEDKGLLEMNSIFSQVSARVSAIGYRADIETALRTPSLAGYQLLSIQDFPGQGTAHVGILDNFMEEKEGGFSNETYRSFNSPVVVLGMLPKLVWTTDEKLTGEICVPNYGQTDLNGLVARWALKDGEKVLAEGELSAQDAPQGEVTTLGSFTTDALSQLTEAKKLTVEVAADSIGNANTYDIWVYPADLDVSDSGDVVVCSNWDNSAKAALDDGKNVLLLPQPSTAAMPESLPVRWTTDYWSRMFHRSDKDAHTMGMYINTEHPIFNDFPTEFFSDYQWFNLMKGSRALILDNAPQEISPLAWNIDHMQWSRKLGSLFEANVGNGKLVVCTFNLLGQMETYPEAKQLYYSILNYMNSEVFEPTVSLTQEDISSMIRETVEGTNAFDVIEAETYSESNNSALRNENGKLEDGTAQTAVGNIKEEDWIRFSDVNFGDNGAKTLILNGANANKYNEVIDVHLDDPDGPLVTTVEFTPTGSWNVYKSQTYTIPRLTGIHDLVLVFHKATFAFNYVKFEETDIVYMDPYQQLNPESAAADIDITNLTENSNHVVMQNYVSQITNQVEIQFNHVDFGFYGSSMAVIAGRSLNGKDVTGSFKYKDEDGAEKTIPFVFKAGAGEEYELSSETFWKQTVLADGITGEQDLKVVFDEGTLFDFEALTFMGSPLPAYEEIIAEAESVKEYASVRPLLYTEESLNAFEIALEEAKKVNTQDDQAVLEVIQTLRAALDSLELTGKSRTAYDVIYARNYDAVDGTVKLEREKPDQVLGGFDKGELLHFNGIDFGINGAEKLVVVAANGRSDGENEPVAKLRFYLDDEKTQYADVVVEQTGGWSASNDKTFMAELDSELFRGVKNITIELLEGAVAFNNFVFVESEAEPETSVTGVKLDRNELSLTVGNKDTLTATVEPAEATDKSVTWSSSDDAVATVDENGSVTAVATGEAIITVTTADGGFTATCTVAVSEKPMERFTITFMDGEIEYKKIVVECGNAVEKPVDPEKDGYTFNGWYTDEECTKSYDFETSVQGDLTLYAGWTENKTSVTGVTLDETELSLFVGDSATLTATVEPAEATNKNVTWTSDNEEVATVVDGKVTAVAAGTANITVTTEDGEYTATCVVTVSEKPADSFTVTFMNGDEVYESKTVTSGETVAEPTAPEMEGYIFTGWYTEGGEQYDFETPVTDNLILYAGWEEIPAPETVTVTFNTNGGSKIDPITVEKGEKVTAPPAPTNGDFDFDGWYTDPACTEPYDFNTAVTENMTLYAGWKMVGPSVDHDDDKEEPEEPEEPTDPEEPGTDIEDPDTPLNPAPDFTDVADDFWGKEAIDYVVAEGLMNGTSETTFAPNVTTTRAMLMTILARMDGVDTTGSDPWYAKGMEWAVAEGVSDGTNPEGTITREQLAVMLYRYAGSPEVSADALTFADADLVSDWAVDGVKWAVANGILSGKGNNMLDPQGNATRAEVAQMLYNFSKIG